MSELVTSVPIEWIVGAKRHPVFHLARAITAMRRVYILHSAACVENYPDLRDCPYSLALDRGINEAEWPSRDVPVRVMVSWGRLVPYELADRAEVL